MANGRTRDYMDDVCLSFSIVWYRTFVVVKKYHNWKLNDHLCALVPPSLNLLSQPFTSNKNNQEYKTYYN
jgi:hypothetical protein